MPGEGEAGRLPGAGERVTPTTTEEIQAGLERGGQTSALPVPQVTPGDIFKRQPYKGHRWHHHFPYFESKR